MMYRRLFRAGAIAGLAMLASCAVSAIDPGTRVVRTRTATGVPVRIGSFAAWDEECRQAGLPVARIMDTPLHGTLEPRHATLVVGSRLYAGKTNCRDERIAGVELWYSPADGFRGTDRMGYEVDAGQGPVRFTSTVDVR